jgi:putative transposase
MQLVEQHVIDRRDPRYAVIDEAAFKSKNLYNAATYEYRQAFIHQGRYLNYHEVQKRMQSSDAYQALPAKVSQQVLMVLDKNWKGFREALKAYSTTKTPRSSWDARNFPSTSTKPRGATSWSTRSRRSARGG